VALEVTGQQLERLNYALAVNRTYSKVSGRKVWTEEMELEIVALIKSGKSACSIIRDHKVSGKKIADIRRKYKLWGA
jgi:transposase-like protein